MTSADLDGIVRASRAWLFDAALPRWAAAGFDARAGLFVEALDLQGGPVDRPHRLRVQARQTFVFAEAGRLGWPGPWRALAEAGLEILLHGSRTAEGGVGYRLGDDGRLTDTRHDLYDQAFVLFALAHVRLLAPRAVDERVREILGFLTTQAAPGGGFLEGDVEPAPRKQNPHMHLLEAGLALAEAGVPEGRALASEMAQVFSRRLYDEVAGVIPEYFDEALQPLSGEAGRVIEPGHHCEWIWLLERLRSGGGGDFSAQSERLWTHAMAHGLVDGVLVDEVWREGGVRRASARLWPQTERLKAVLSRTQLAGTDADDIAAAYRGLDLYLSDAPEGLWRDRRRPGGGFDLEPAPATSLYHILIALTELWRTLAKG